MTGSDAMAPLAALAGEKEKTASGAVGSGNYISVNEPYGMQGYAYCGTSIRYSFDRSGCTLLDGCSNPAYVPTIRQYMENQGWRISSNANAEAGDIFVYGSDQHVGFVFAAYSGTTKITLEGNSTVYATLSEAKSSTAGTGSFEGIGYKKRTLDSNYKVYRPPYASNGAATTTTSGGDVEVTLDTLQQGSTGAQVKTLQRILYARGIKGADGQPISVDGNDGNNTVYATKIMQGELGLDKDGIVGPKTWDAMLKSYN